MYKAEKPSVCLSVMPIPHLGLPTSTYRLSNTINTSSSNVLQICHHELMWWSACILQQVEYKEEEKTQATFHWKLQHKSAMRRATDLHSVGCGLEFSWWTIFFQNYTFYIQVIWNSALIAWLLGIPNTSRNGTWAKINACHLETWICWLLMDICFCLLFTAHWRHWCREKTSNSPVKTT